MRSFKACFLLSLITLVCIQDCFTQDTIPGLIASFSFNGNIQDRSNNGIRTSYSDTLIFMEGRNGEPNGAIYTSQYDYLQNKPVKVGRYIRILDSIPFQNLDGSDFTVSCWIKYNQPFSDGSAFLFKDIGAFNGQMISFCQPYFNSLYGKSLGWYHFVWKFQNNNVSEYLNDSLCGTKSRGNYLNTAPYLLKKYLLVYEMEGAVDDLNIYNRALSDAEITQLYKAPVITGTAAPTPAHILQIYPNPSYDQIMIGMNGTAVIYNAMGEAVKTSAHSIIPIADIAVGSYSIKVTQTDGMVYFGRFVKN